jgi:hypothetical protein
MTGHDLKVVTVFELVENCLKGRLTGPLEKSKVWTFEAPLWRIRAGGEGGEGGVDHKVDRAMCTRESIGNRPVDKVSDITRNKCKVNNRRPGMRVSVVSEFSGVEYVKVVVLNNGK